VAESARGSVASGPYPAAMADVQSTATGKSVQHMRYRHSIDTSNILTIQKITLAIGGHIARTVAQAQCRMSGDVAPLSSFAERRQLDAADDFG